MPPAQHLLDQVQSIARIDALAASPGEYAEALAGEVPAAATLPELEARDAMLGTALGQIDALATRAMRIRLEHGLASDSSIGPPTRNVFASTVVSYADKLPLLGQRARDIAARAGAATPDRTAEAVVDAARSVLDLREGLRGGVLDPIRRLAAASVAEADRHARDKNLDDATRKKWSAARRDLETLAQQPESVAVAPMATRLAAWPEQIDEPEPEREVTRTELLELD